MNKTVDQIIGIFDACHAGETACDESHFREGIQFYTDRGLPVPFVFLAFPGKSINGHSVSGPLPDLGERLALQTLKGLVEAASRIYPPGIELHILSEGHCFLRTGCMRSPEEMDAYVAALKAMKDCDRISLHTIHDFYPDGDMADKVAAFERDYMPQPDEINAAIANDPLYAAMYPDRAAFVYREFSPVLFPTLPSKRRKIAMSKIIARSFIGHQMAVKRLLQDHFGGHIRLSIHQQHDPASQKYYINLLPGVEGKGTPWYHVVERNGDVLQLVKRVRSAPSARPKNREPGQIYAGRFESAPQETQEQGSLRL